MINKKELKRLLKKATGCTIQHNGWTCRTCFFAMGGGLKNEDWQSLLLKRGDYTKESLDNLPNNIHNSLNKIVAVASRIINQ